MLVIDYSSVLSNPESSRNIPTYSVVMMHASETGLNFHYVGHLGSQTLVSLFFLANYCLECILFVVLR